jgi:hypothetical protein
MTYTLIILIFVATHDARPAATVPLSLSNYETAAACNTAARDVIKQQVLDRYEKELATSQADELRPVCVPTPRYPASAH